MGSAQYDSRGISAADTWAYFRQLLGQAGVGTLLGMGPQGTLVTGVMAGICRVFPFPLYVWQKARAHQQRLGHCRYGGHCDNSALGKPLKAFLWPAQLRDMMSESTLSILLPKLKCPVCAEAHERFGSGQK